MHTMADGGEVIPNPHLNNLSSPGFNMAVVVTLSCSTYEDHCRVAGCMFAFLDV